MNCPGVGADLTLAPLSSRALPQHFPSPPTSPEWKRGVALPRVSTERRLGGVRVGTLLFTGEGETQITF